MIQQACIEAYRKLKNLKLVGDDLGIPWQTVYVHLRNAGEPVNGDKARYGCAKDRLASFAERLFSEDVPDAVDANASQFQAAIDFTVHGWTVDVKAATRRQYAADAPRWAFCINKQKDKADFFVFYAFDNADDRNVVHAFLMPSEIATTSASISIPETMKSKWSDYRVDRESLADFFASLPSKTII